MESEAAPLDHHQRPGDVAARRGERPARPLPVARACLHESPQILARQPALSDRCLGHGAVAGQAEDAPTCLRIRGTLSLDVAAVTLGRTRCTPEGASPASPCVGERAARSRATLGPSPRPPSPD